MFSCEKQTDLLFSLVEQLLAQGCGGELVWVALLKAFGWEGWTGKSGDWFAVLCAWKNIEVEEGSRNVLTHIKGTISGHQVSS